MSVPRGGATGAALPCRSYNRSVLVIRSRLGAALVALVLLPALACGDAAEDDLSNTPPAPGAPAKNASVEARVVGTGTNGLRVREKPTTGSLQVGTLEEGATVIIDCQIEGESINGNTVWDHIPDQRGYVSDAYIDGERGFAKGLKRCDDGTTTPRVPTGDGGTVTIEGPPVKPHVQAFVNDACAMHGAGACRPSTYAGHSPSADLAVDLPTSASYGTQESDDGVYGEKVAAWALENQTKYRITYVIHRQRINSGSGWRAMDDRGSITQNHFDHVHVSFDP